MKLPEDLETYLRRPEIIKVAWNAAFERAVLKYALGKIIWQSETGYEEALWIH